MTASVNNKSVAIEIPGPPFFASSMASMGKRIWTKLHVIDVRYASLFDELGRIKRVVDPQSPAFPAGVRVINPAIHPASEQAHRIRNADNGPLLGCRMEGQQRVGIRAGDNRGVLTHSENIELIHTKTV